MVKTIPPFTHDFYYERTVGITLRLSWNVVTKVVVLIPYFVFTHNVSVFQVSVLEVGTRVIKSITFSLPPEV